MSEKGVYNLFLLFGGGGGGSVGVLLEILPRDVHLEALLDDEEGGLGLELPARVGQLELEVAQQPRDHLVDLQQRQVPTDADVGAAAELIEPC